MTKKLFLRSNSEIMMDKARTSKENPKNEMPVYTSKPQLRPRMMLEGIDAPAAWYKEQRRLELFK